MPFETFDAVDTNGDGEISREEYAIYASKRNLPRNLFDDIDANGDGFINREEWNDFLAGNDPPPPPELTMATFDDIDVDGSGDITRMEWAVYARKKGYPKNLFDKIDYDGDGTITRQEWNKYVRHKAPANAPAALSLRTFDLIDVNGDGEISKEEWTEYAYNFGLPKQLFDEIDANGDGFLTREEWNSYSRGQLLSMDHFDAIDANHDGSISRKEYNAYAKSKFLPLELFDAVDADGDGEITRAEWNAYFKRQVTTPEVPSLSLGMFNAIDLNRDDIISRDEWNSYARAMLLPKHAFDLIDTNKDDLITRDEWDYFVKRQALSMDTFNSIDTNGDGSINREEWNRYARNMALGKNIFDMIDQNGDGEIQREEWQDYVIRRGYVPGFEGMNTTRAKPLSDKEFARVAREVGMLGLRSLRSKISGQGKDGPRPITLEDVLTLFRRYEITAKTAKSFFEYIDVKNKGYVDFNTFQDCFSRHGLDSFCGGQGELDPESSRSMDRQNEDFNRTEHMSSLCRDRAKDEVSFRRTLELISQAAICKHSNMTKFLLHCRQVLGRNRSQISRYEMQVFFRKYGFGEQEADRFFYSLSNGSEFARYNDFIQLFAPHVETGHVTYDPHGPKTPDPPRKTVNHHVSTNIFSGTVYPVNNPHGLRDRPRPRRPRSTPACSPLAKEPPLQPPDLTEVFGSELAKAIRQISEVADSRELSKEKAVRRAFKCLDSNDNGYVSLEEVKVFFRVHGFNNMKLATRFYAILDKDRKGEVDVDYFKSFFQHPH